MGCSDTCDASVYEIAITLEEPILSLTIRTNPNDFEGYKPLQLDSSILLLEPLGKKCLPT